MFFLAFGSTRILDEQVCCWAGGAGGARGGPPWCLCCIRVSSKAGGGGKSASVLLSCSMRKVRIGRGGGGVSEFGGASEVDIEAGGSEAELGLGAETQVDGYFSKISKN